MIQEQHISSIKIENYKKFDSLEVSDIGQFNLIVGDNNVGKTSLLEVLASVDRINEDRAEENVILDFCQALIRRKIYVDGDAELFFRYLAGNNASPISVNIHFSDNSSADIKLLSTQNPHVVRIHIENSILNSYSVDKTLSNVKLPMALIPANIEVNETLPEEYQKVLDYSRSNKKRIIENLRVIDSKIVEIEVLPVSKQPHVMIGFENDDRYLPLTGLGESAVRVFYYLLQIIRNKDKKLFIDEIDTGIHYTRLKSFLKAIFQIAISNNVQLFLTTHSLECQQAFAQVFEDEDMAQYQGDARQFTLIEKPNGQVTAIKRNWEQLEFALQTENDTRGGKQTW